MGKKKILNFIYKKKNKKSFVFGSTEILQRQRQHVNTLRAAIESVGKHSNARSINVHAGVGNQYLLQILRMKIKRFTKVSLHRDPELV